MSAPNAVYKYPVPMVDEVSVWMPRGARILSIENQRGSLVMYALVTPGGVHGTRRFRIAMTGHALTPDDAGVFVGTVQFSGGDLVFHVFDLGEAQA